MTVPPPTRPVVLVTGAAGRIGTTLRERLPALGWTVRPFDTVAVDGVPPGDITSPSDLDAALHDTERGDAAGGRPVTAVVHLAGVPTEVPWSQVRHTNVDGTYQVFEAARRNGVRRLVYASSNHAAGFTPNPPATAGPLPAGTPPRPDTLYGVSKAFGEALARYYADRYRMAVACLRIGTFAPTPPDRRSLATWLSPADCAALVDACLRAPALEYAVVRGISANTRRTWSLAEGEALGYHPSDDAERWADRLGGLDPDPCDVFVGGRYTTGTFGIDEVADRDR